MPVPTKLSLLTPDELEALPDLEWLVAGIIPAPSLSVLYGEPGCGKSFAALSIALSVSRGTPWLGRDVTAGSVLYIAAEGALGFKSRVAADRERNGAVPTTIRFLATAPNILTDKDLEDVIKAVRQADFDPKLIVIDTLARVIVGADENNAKDMGRVVEALDKLKTAFGAAVLVLHHSTKGGGDLPRDFSSICD